MSCLVRSSLVQSRLVCSGLVLSRPVALQPLHQVLVRPRVNQERLWCALGFDLAHGLVMRGQGDGRGNAELGEPTVLLQRCELVYHDGLEDVSGLTGLAMGELPTAGAQADLPRLRETHQPLIDLDIKLFAVQTPHNASGGLQEIAALLHVDPRDRAELAIGDRVAWGHRLQAGHDGTGRQAGGRSGTGNAVDGGHRGPPAKECVSCRVRASRVKSCRIMSRPVESGRVWSCRVTSRPEP